MAVNRIWFVSPLFQDVESFLVLRDHIRDTLGDTPALPAGELRFVAVDDTGGFDAGSNG